jgi:hypothetical protein
MNIKIGYKKKNGETAGAVIRIDDDGSIRLFDHKTNESILSFWLINYKPGSAVVLGVDEDDI